MSQQNISELSADELQQKLKRLKSEKIMNAVLLGFAFGVFVYSAIKSGLNSGTIITLLALYFFFRNAKNRDAVEKEVLSEITKRENI